MVEMPNYLGQNLIEIINNFTDYYFSCYWVGYGHYEKRRLMEENVRKDAVLPSNDCPDDFYVPDDFVKQYVSVVVDDKNMTTLSEAFYFLEPVFVETVKKNGVPEFPRIGGIVVSQERYCSNPYSGVKLVDRDIEMRSIDLPCSADFFLSTISKYDPHFDYDYMCDSYTRMYEYFSSHMDVARLIRIDYMRNVGVEVFISCVNPDPGLYCKYVFSEREGIYYYNLQFAEGGETLGTNIVRCEVQGHKVYEYRRRFLIDFMNPAVKFRKDWRSNTSASYTRSSRQGVFRTMGAYAQRNFQKIFKTKSYRPRGMAGSTGANFAPYQKIPVEESEDSIIEIDWADCITRYLVKFPMSVNSTAFRVGFSNKVMKNINNSCRQKCSYVYNKKPLILSHLDYLRTIPQLSQYLIPSIGWYDCGDSKFSLSPLIVRDEKNDSRENNTSGSVISIPIRGKAPPPKRED